MSRKKQNDEPMIPCPSCGVENRIASPFCKDCGDRIYKHGAAPTQEATHSAKEKGNGARAFQNALNSLIFLGIIAVIALAFWPYATLSVPKAYDPGEQVRQYVQIVENNIGKDRQLPVAHISQRNLNAFIGKNNISDTNKIVGVIMQAPGLELIANEPVGPFNLSTRIQMTPTDGNRAPKVSTFWVGHLPLPPVFASPWTRSLSKRFDLDLDPALWDHLTLDRVEGGKVHVVFAP